MSDTTPPRPGEPGYENQPRGSAGRQRGATRRTEPGPPSPGTNQGKAEPIDDAPAGGTVGRGQPDAPRRGADRPAVAQGGAHDVAGGPGAGTAHRQPQHYGVSPEPIGTDDVAGAESARPGGPPWPADATAETGDEADATYGLRREAMPGTTEEAAQATGVRRAVYEGEA